MSMVLAISLLGVAALKTHQRSVANDAKEAAVMGLLQSWNYATAILDNHGRVVFWNPAMEELTGWSKNEMFHQPVTRLMPPELAKRHEESFLKNLQAAIGTGEVLRVPCALIRKDGSRALVIVSTRVVATDGEPVYAIAQIDRSEQVKEVEGER